MPSPQRKVPPSRACDHLGCDNRAALKLTWPHPIRRQEKHCREHAESTLGAFVPGLIFERVGEENG